MPSVLHSKLWGPISPFTTLTQAAGLRGDRRQPVLFGAAFLPSSSYHLVFCLNFASALILVQLGLVFPTSSGLFIARFLGVLMATPVLLHRLFMMGHCLLLPPCHSLCHRQGTVAIKSSASVQGSFPGPLLAHICTGKRIHTLGFHQPR